MMNKRNYLAQGMSFFRSLSNIIKFFFDYLRFKKFLKNQHVINKPTVVSSKKICITIVPWLGSAVPWYSIAIALILYRKGNDVLILFDDTLFGDDFLFNRVQSNLILKILNKLPIRLTKLSNYNSTVISSSEVEHLSKLNSLHYAHGETNHAFRQSYEKIVKKQLTSAYMKINACFEDNNFNQIIIPGGIWGTSGIYTLFSKKYKTQLTSYDSDDSEMWMSIFGIAAQLGDIPYSFDRLIENKEERNFAIQKGNEQLKKRREGRDKTQSHFLEATNTSEFGDDYYLMLLNSVWDTAALGLHTVYDSMIDWILDSVEWVLTNTEKTILIRQHPAERGKQINNTDSYEEKIVTRFGNNKRIKFIEAKDDINTYDLVENAFCILGFCSTIIVESVMLGKPAIIVSNTYYSNFGIVYSARDKKEYYMYLKKSSQNDSN